MFVFIKYFFWIKNCINYNLEVSGYQCRQTDCTNGHADGTAHTYEYQRYQNPRQSNHPEREQIAHLIAISCSSKPTWL